MFPSTPAMFRKTTFDDFQANYTKSRPLPTPSPTDGA